MRIDSHVHILGDGSSGSGCFLNLKNPYHKLLSQIIISGLGVPKSALVSGLDDLYVNRLVEMVRESSIDKVIILAHEYPHDDKGNPLKDLGSFYTPNDYVLSLAKKYSDCFIPAIAIHPARADAIDELDRFIELGAGMLKLLPNCQNVDCSNPRYKKFWEKLSKAHIPFLAHTGGELSVPVLNASYANPEILKLPLECGVNVIAAHSGTRSLLWDKHYTPVFLKMLEKYPNLYGDNSGMNTPFRSAYHKEILSHSVQERIIHGSDIPIPISAFWNLLRKQITFSEFKKAQKSKNLIERDAQIKASLGFEPDTFTRINSILPYYTQAQDSNMH